MPKFSLGGEAIPAEPLPPPVAGGHAGGYSEAWLEELDGLLRAYHEQLYVRLDRRLVTAVAELRQQVTPAGSAIGPRARAPAAPPPAATSEALAPELREQVTPAGTAIRLGARAPAAPPPPAEPSEALPLDSPDSPAVKVHAAEADLDEDDEVLQRRASEASELYRTDSQDPSADFGRSSGLRRLVKHQRFEAFFGFMIVTNAIYIAVQTDLTANGIALESDTVFFTISVAYTLIFAVELVLRMLAHGRHFFTHGGSVAWNTLDLFVVLVSLIEAALDLAVRLDSGLVGDAQGPTQFRILRLLRITKVIRLVRVTRIIRFIRALRTLVHQVISAFKSMVWALVLLLIVIFLFGILFTQATTAHRMHSLGGLEPVRFDLVDDPLMAYWSTLPRSMYTLFKAITGGLSWEEAAHPLSDVAQTWVVVFLAYICFAQLAVLNVLTGVFCQNAIDSASHDQDLVTQSVLAHKKMYVKQIQTIFKEIDVDSSGSITIQEFKDHLENERMQAYFDSLGLDTSDVWTLFKLLDADKGSIIEFDEFVSGCLRLKGYAKGVDIAKLSYEHRWMAKRLGNFIQRTDQAFARLLHDGDNGPPRLPERGGGGGGGGGGAVLA